MMRGIDAFAAGTVGAAVATCLMGAVPAGAATTAGDAGTQYIVVNRARVAHDKRSVSGEIRWHTKTLSQGVNSFTVWAGLVDGQAVTPLGSKRMSAMKVNSQGVMAFTLKWGTSKALKVADATEVRLSVTQRFTKKDSSKTRAVSSSVTIPTNGRWAVPAAPTAQSCPSNWLKPSANLFGCRFLGVDMWRVDIHNSNLRLAQFTNCNLEGVNFKDTFGNNPIFIGNELGGASFDNSLIPEATFGEKNHYYQTTFRSTNLSNATFAPIEQGSEKPVTNAGTKCPPRGTPGPCMFVVK